MRYNVRPPGARLWKLIDTDSLAGEVEQGRVDGTSRIRRDGESGEWSVDELCRIESASKIAQQPPTPAAQPLQTQSEGVRTFPFRRLLLIVVVGLVVFRVVRQRSDDRAVAEYLARPLDTEIVADDPAARGVVTKAIQTPFQAASCRIQKEVSNSVNGFHSSKTTAEITNRGKVHILEEVDGRLKSESFTDGQRLLIRDTPDGQFKEETQDVAGKIKRLAPSIGDPSPEDKMQRAGHEDINGVRASIYKWESSRLYVTKMKLWIADADGRLLKTTSESKGTFAFKKTPIHVDASSTTNYDYDVALNISLPGQ